MILLRLALPFSATHQILIAGAMEPVHGHDFVCVIEVECADTRDAATLEPTLHEALGELARTHLEAVSRTQGGHPSAERIAAHLFTAMAGRLTGDDRLHIHAVTVHEAPGCAATYTFGIEPATRL